MAMQVVVRTGCAFGRRSARPSGLAQSGSAKSSADLSDVQNSPTEFWTSEALATGQLFVFRSTGAQVRGCKIVGYFHRCAKLSYRVLRSYGNCSWSVVGGLLFVVCWSGLHWDARGRAQRLRNTA